MRYLNEIIIHCTATPPTTTVESIKKYHLSKGWRDIGYHFLVQNGVVINGRDIRLIGAHCLGRNKNTIGVAYIGTYPTKRDVQTLANLCNMLIKQYNITKISRHCNYTKYKTCPNFDKKDIELFNTLCAIPIS